MKFDKVKYDNQYIKENYDRISVIVPKGQKELIKNKAKKKGFASINEYIKYLINKDVEKE